MKIIKWEICNVALWLMGDMVVMDPLSSDQNPSFITTSTITTGWRGFFLNKNQYTPCGWASIEVNFQRKPFATDQFWLQFRNIEIDQSTVMCSQRFIPMRSNRHIIQSTIWHFGSWSALYVFNFSIISNNFHFNYHKWKRITPLNWVIMINVQFQFNVFSSMECLSFGGHT